MSPRISDVPRRRRNAILDRAQDDDGLLAELITAEVFDVFHDNSDAWYDARNQNTGTKYESKSAHRDVGEDYPAKGRFRLWESQHRRLAGAEGAEGQTAYYSFVLFEDDQPVDIRRMRPSTVTRILRDRGEDSVAWNKSGHESQGKQHKLPYTEVFDE